MKFSLALRIPPVLLTIITGVLMWLISKTNSPLLLPETLRFSSVIVLAVTASAVGLAGVAAFRRAETTVNPLSPENCSSLVESGIFRFTRNPMYLALLLALIAWGILLGNLWSLSMVVVFVLYINRFQIKPEEEALEAAFGNAFRQYRSRVRKWL